jgi:putative protease
MEEKLVGKITHYYGHIGVGIIELSDTLKTGETIHIKGHATDFTQPITSIQIEHASVSEGQPGDSIGIKVNQKVHEHDAVYKVIG